MELPKCKKSIPTVQLYETQVQERQRIGLRQSSELREFNVKARCFVDRIGYYKREWKIHLVYNILLGLCLLVQYLGYKRYGDQWPFGMCVIFSVIFCKVSFIHYMNLFWDIELEECMKLRLSYTSRIVLAEDLLNTVRSTVASHRRVEQRHNLSNSPGRQPDTQNTCGLQSSNLFKKKSENTLDERLVDDMSVRMKSVGAIVCDGVRGTVFRVGSKYIMTALHVVTGITNPRKLKDIPENDWSKLEELNVWVTFAASPFDLQSPTFYLKKNVIFLDKRLDVAVVELKSRNNLPRKLQLSKEMGQIEHVHLIGFGHQIDPRKQLDAHCITVTVTDQLFRRIERESENILQRYSLRAVLQLHSLDPNLLTGSYNELFDRERFVCHAAMEHGASGAPAIAENEVVGLFVKGLPMFYYELKSRASTAQYVQHFPNQLRFELCCKTDYIYRILINKNPMLAEDLFD